MSHMTIKDLKSTIKDLPDDMPVIIPPVGINELLEQHLFTYRDIRGTKVINLGLERPMLCIYQSLEGGSVMF